MSNKPVQSQKTAKDDRDSYHQTYASHKDKRRIRRERKGYK